MSLIFEDNVPARMRDGVTLKADVYRPAAPGRYPLLLVRSPYGKERDRVFLASILDPVRAARAGYVVIYQDCRGCGASEGETEFGNMLCEGEDGYDSVEWAAALPYGNGAVGMFGLSYLGTVQFLAAQERPPHLKAIAPMQTGIHSLSAMLFRQGAMDMAGIVAMVGQGGAARLRAMAQRGASPAERSAYLHQLAKAQDQLYADGYRELPLNRLASLEHLGLAEVLAPIVAAGPGQPSSFQVDLAALPVPALLIGGWYDLLLQAGIDIYQELRRQGKPCQLLIGPWRHGDLSQRRECTMGEMNFGLAASGAAIDLEEDLTSIHLRWFDRWLKEIDNGVEREAPVRVFVMGENRWRRLDDWSPGATRQEPWFLQQANGLGRQAPAEAQAAHYRYDPQDPTPTLGGSSLFGGLYAAGVKDQSPLSARQDVLTFTSAVLEEPLTILGRVSAELWAGSSAPDTDFVVRLIDMQPNGYMHNLCDGIVRARYRHSLSEPKWLEPGIAYRLVIDLWSTAHTFKPGHRIVVQVASSNFPRYDRNLNTQEAPGTGIRGVTAEQTIWLGGDRPSHVRLPVFPST